MADEKKKPPAPAMTAKVDGTLYALAFDAATNRAFVGGSAGRIDVVDVTAETWEPREFARPGGYVSGLALAGDHVVAAGYDGALRWYDASKTKAKSPATPVREVRGAHRGWIRDLVAFADGTRLATVGDDVRTKIWNAADGELVAEFNGHAAETPQGYVSTIYAVAATPNGRYVAAGDRVGKVVVWDLQTGREVLRFDCPQFYTFDGEKRDRSIGGIRRLRFSPDGERLAVAGIGQITNVDGFVGPCRIEVYDWRAKKRIALLDDDHKAVLNDVAWTSDGTRLVGSGGGDAGGVLAVWPMETGAKDGVKPIFKGKFGGHTQRLAWLESDRRLLAAGFEAVQLWDKLTNDESVNEKG